MNPRWQRGAAHAFVFDLDGTLTRPQHDFDAIRSALGIPMGRLILEYIAEQPAERARKLRADLDEIEVALAAKAAPAPGVRELLERARALGHPLGILTRNSRDNALAALRAIAALDLFEDACILGRDEARPKPDPDGLQRLCAAWRLPTTHCTMVGDSRLDLQAGRAAGAYTVHVSRRGERYPEHTDLHVPSLATLAALLAA